MPGTHRRVLINHQAAGYAKIVVMAEVRPDQRAPGAVVAAVVAAGRAVRPEPAGGERLRGTGRHQRGAAGKGDYMDL
ncbi:hypothetical protein GCM10009527_051070 [Actinomadura nitritigenes]